MTELFRTPGIAIQLEEGKTSPPEWLQIIRTGNFRHPSGPLPITLEVLNSFKKNFDDKVLGIDIMGDYSHNSDKEAACWVREVEVRPDEKGAALFAKVRWTPRGAEKVVHGEFRYTSADFEFDYQDNESGKKFGPTLKGFGLTNRPFVKRMAPAVELSEITEGESKMTDLEKANAEVKRLSDELKVAVDGKAQVEGEKKKLEDGLAGKSPEELVAKIQELEAKVAELEGQLSEKAKAVDSEKQLAEKETQFTKLLSEGKVVAAQKEHFISGDVTKFAELSQAVNLDPKGSGAEKKDEASGEKKDAGDRIIELAEKLVSEKKAKNMTDAQAMVLKDPANAALRAEYEKSPE